MSKAARVALLMGAFAPFVSAVMADTYVPASPDNDTNVPPVVISAYNTPYSELFNGFLGTQASLPAGFFVESSLASPFNSTDYHSATGKGGFLAYGASGDAAFGMLERGVGKDLRDARVYFKFKNTTGATLERVNVTYFMEQWYDGSGRVNRIRLKFNDDIAGFSSQPELTTATNLTDAPVTTNNDAAVNGTSNRRTVDQLIILDPPLANNAVGYFRWQFSTVSGSGDNRDGLAINDFTLTALENGDPVLYNNATNGTWQDGVGTWTNAASSQWSNTAGYNAVFDSNDTSKVVNLGGNVEAIDVVFQSTGVVINGGSNTLLTKGVIDVQNVSHTASINAIITGGKVFKTGPGILEVGGANTFTGGVTIQKGTLKPTSASAIPDGSQVALTDTTSVLNLATASPDIASLSGASGSVVLGSNTLVIDSTGANSTYGGTITGTGGLTKKGPATQTFKSNAKAYTGATLVEDGVLEMTDDGTLTATSEIRVTSASGKQGEIAFTTDESSNENFSFPVPIELESGYLRAESEGGVTLTSNVQLVSGENRIYSSGDAGHEFHITGTITGSGDLRKNGSGELYLDSSGNTYTGETEINNGKIIVPSTGSLGGGKLWITDPDEERELILQKSVTVAGLEGNSEELPAAQSGFITLDGNITFTIDQGAALDAGEEVAPSYQGEFREVNSANAGVVVKTGLGTTRLTRQPKAFTGHVEVNNGVLEISHGGRFTNVAEIEVNSGGQLRLTSGSNDIGVPLVYDFGGDVVLKSTARSLGGVITANSGFGELGGLRVDGNTVVTPPEEPELFTELASNVVIASASDIHVNGVDAVLFLSGDLSGSAALDRTGGGTVVINGDATGYTGTLTQTNGTTELAAGQVLGGNVEVDAGTLAIEADAEIQGDLTVAAGATIAYAADPSNIIIVGGNATLAAGAVIDFGGTGTPGATYTVIAAGSVSLGGTISVIGTPTTATVNNTGADLEITLAP